METASKQLKLSEVVGYIQERYGVRVARQTIYNWADPDKGHRYEYISTSSIAGPGTTRVRVTTTADVDNFVSRAFDGTIDLKGH
jgi:hypothetical protein